VISAEAQLRELMIASLSGDTASYRSLLEELRHRLRRYFRKRLGFGPAEDAEDLVQETLMAVHSRRATYDPNRPFTPWLHAIAHYKLVDHFRQRNRKQTVPIDGIEELFADDVSEAASARLDVQRLLETLPVRTQTLIRRVRVEGQSTTQVAVGLGMSASAVKVNIHRGIKALSGRTREKADDHDE